MRLIDRAPPLPVELRERAVAASDAYGLDRAAHMFQVGTASLKRWRALARKHGSVAPKPMGGDRRGSAKTAAKLEEAVAEKPDRILRELSQWFEERIGRLISQSGVCRALHQLGLHRRRKTILASERSRQRVIDARREYLAKVALIDPLKLVFLDESGCQRGMMRRDAWRKAGSAVVGRTVRNRGTVTTVLGALSHRGLIAVMYGEGATTTEVFVAFVKDVLVPELHPGDVVVMDNLGAHRPDQVRALIEAAGASVLWLPPYSPELNPIEPAWSKLKNYVRTLAPQSLRELHAAITKGVGTVTTTDARGWFKNCGLLLA